MGSGNVSLFGRAAGRGWSAQDLADLYRIAEQLDQLGFPVAVHSGLSDEGDPWAVFERREGGEVVVHVARIDSELVIADAIRGRVHRGRDFRALADRLLADAPLALPQGGPGGNVVLHPRMVMTAFVAAAMVVAEFARPAEAATAPAGAAPPSGPGAPGEALPDKAAGRDTATGLSASHLAGQGTAQGIGIGSLAAGLAALSAQLAQGATEGRGPGAPEAGALPPVPGVGAGLFGGDLPGWSLLSRLDAAADPADADPQSVDATAPRAEGRARPELQRPEREAEARPEQEAAAPAPDPAAPPPAIPTDAPAQVGARAADLRAANAPRPAETPDPARESETAAVPASAAALDQVTAAFTVLDQLRLPKLDLDGVSEGAILVRVDDAGAAGLLYTSLDDGPDEGDPLIHAQPCAAIATPERFLLLSPRADHLTLTPEAGNVVVYMGGDVSVSGFTFGRDRIAFIEEAAAPDWLASVSIEGPDVVLVGQDGGSVTLLGAAATLV